MKSILFCLAMFVVFSCKTREPEPVKSAAKNILSFSFPSLSIDASIDTVNNEISAVVPSGTDVTKLAPSISVSGKATISPASGVVQDFSKPVMYTITAEDGSTRVFTATVMVKVVPAVISLTGKWKVELYLEGKLQASEKEENIRFYDNGTFEFSQKRMAAKNDSAWIEWATSKYEVQPYAKLRASSSGVAEDLDKLGIGEKDAPFFLTLPGGGFGLQYRSSTGGVRAVYNSNLIIKAMDKEIVGLYPLIDNNLLEIRLISTP